MAASSASACRCPALQSKTFVENPRNIVVPPACVGSVQVEKEKKAAEKEDKRLQKMAKQERAREIKEEKARLKKEAKAKGDG